MTFSDTILRAAAVALIVGGLYGLVRPRRGSESHVARRALRLTGLGAILAGSSAFVPEGLDLGVFLPMVGLVLMCYAAWVPRLASTKSRVLVGGFACAALAITVFAFAPPYLTSFATSADRTLYFKLPIEGERFHWVFLDREAFLSGELTLRILNKDRDQTLVVFRDGRILDGWKMIGEERPDRGFYFGFTTTDRFRTKANDSLIVTLKATKDLRGRGPYSEGVLSAGVWQMSGTYSSIYGGRWNLLDFAGRDGEPPIASMQCWTGVWPITITKREGWQGAPPRDEISVARKVNRSRGTNGRLCGSHI